MFELGLTIKVEPHHHPLHIVNFVLGTLKKKQKPKIKLTVSAKGVPQRKLQLVKTPRSNLPRHPMPFAAKNMYYDERWIEKQEEGNTLTASFLEVSLTMLICVCLCL